MRTSQGTLKNPALGSPTDVQPPLLTPCPSVCLSTRASARLTRRHPGVPTALLSSYWGSILCTRHWLTARSPAWDTEAISVASYAKATVVPVLDGPREERQSQVLRGGAASRLATEHHSQAVSAFRPLMPHPPALLFDRCATCPLGRASGSLSSTR